ncbi:MAG: tRNA threonylcarbamoyladenosine dehydratase [Clostridia bacterium]
MENNIFERSELLLGKNSTTILSSKKVAIFGLGGVGSYVAEGLARSGIGEFLLVDNDVVNPTNINRQLIALHSTIGKQKTLVEKNRILDINPNAIVNTLECFYLPENADQIDLTKFDYVIDAIDTVTAKIELATRCDKLEIPLISAMGTGNKLSPFNFVVTDIFDTKVCPLAKVMRHELKKRGISHLKVLYSLDEPKIIQSETDENGKRLRAVTASVPFVPSVAGLLIASVVVNDLIKGE